MRATCCCSTPTRKSSTGRSGSWWRLLDARPRGRPGGRAPVHGRRQRCGRRSAASPASPGRSARRSSPSAGRSTRRGPESACSTRAAYERERECDWTSGSFMLARREALLSAGLLDERSFIYSEEPDLCLRIKRARLGGTPPAPDDDRPPRRQGRRPPADGRPGRLRAQAVRAQALQPRVARPLPLGLRVRVTLSVPPARVPPAVTPPPAARAHGVLCARWPAAPSRPSARRPPPRSPRSSTESTATPRWKQTSRG